MAPEQNKTQSGGNRPKPQQGAGSSAQSAKDRSRAQSRAVSTRSPGGKAGKAKGAGSATPGQRGGNTPRPRPQGRPGPAAPAGRRISGAVIAWSAVGLVVVIVAVLLIVKATGSPDNSFTPTKAAPASVVHDVTNIPASVYDTVGVNSPTVPVTPPTIVPNQPPMTIDGKSPAMLYYGAEYCPFCAAERWAMTAALSRFGTWSGLKITASSHTDYAAGTNTFSYHGATLTSPYITFAGIEQFSNVPSSSPNGFTTLQNPTPEQMAIITKYSSSKYNPNATTQGGVSFPFVSINNLAIISGASYNPTILAGQSWSDIASGLSNPNNPATQAIVATANYISAAICASSKGAPASVCQSSGVQAATKALKLG